MRLMLLAAYVATLGVSGPHASASIAESSVVLEALPASPAVSVEKWSGTIVLSAADGSDKTLTVPIRNNPLRLTAAAGSRWYAHATASNLWIARTEIAFPEAGAETRISTKAWPAAVIRGRLKQGDPKAPRPDAVELSIDSVPLPARAGEIERQRITDCVLDDGSRWSCRVPAVAIDVSVRAKGYVPHYAWGITPSPLRAVDLGEIELRKGGSVTAWLSSSAAREKDVQARLSRLAAPVASDVKARLAHPVASAAATKRGFIQLAPVPSGEYVLEVTAPGFAPTRVSPVKVYEGKESAIRKAIDLEAPLAIMLSIEPPSDTRGKPWRLIMTRSSEFGPAADPFRTVRASFDLSGEVEIRDQVPGAYHVTVEDSAGNRVLYETFAVTAAADSTRKFTVTSHAISGRVTLGSEPLPGAQLSFGGRDGAVRVQATTSESGEFDVQLPKRGRWRIDVSSKERRLQTVTNVFIEDDQKTLDIELPNGVISGRIVRDGAGVAGANVVLLLPDPVITRADERGEFRTTGLPAGVIRVQGTDRRSGESTQQETIDLARDEVRENIVLELRPVTARRGRVLAGGKPVVGAAVLAFSIETPNVSSRVAVTDLDGRFKVDVPAAARSLIFNVMPPMKAFTAIAALVADEELVLNVHESAGTLVIAAPPETPFTLMQNGVHIVVSEAIRWAEGYGEIVRGTGEFRLPQFAPGVYRACANAGKAAVCSEGMLAPHGTLTLDLRKPR